MLREYIANIYNKYSINIEFWILDNLLKEKEKKKIENVNIILRILFYFSNSKFLKI